MKFLFTNVANFWLVNCVPLSETIVRGTPQWLKMLRIQLIVLAVVACFMGTASILFEWQFTTTSTSFPASGPATFMCSRDHFFRVFG